MPGLRCRNTPPRNKNGIFEGGSLKTSVHLQGRLLGRDRGLISGAKEYLRIYEGYQMEKDTENESGYPHAP